MHPAERPEFSPNAQREMFHMTFDPGGYLRRRR